MNENCPECGRNTLRKLSENGYECANDECPLLYCHHEPNGNFNGIILDRVLKREKDEVVCPKCGYSATIEDVNCPKCDEDLTYERLMKYQTQKEKGVR